MYTTRKGNSCKKCGLHQAIYLLLVFQFSGVFVAMLESQMVWLKCSVHVIKIPGKKRCFRQICPAGIHSLVWLRVCFFLTSAPRVITYVGVQTLIKFIHSLVLHVYWEKTKIGLSSDHIRYSLISHTLSVSVFLSFCLCLPLLGCWKEIMHALQSPCIPFFLRQPRSLWINNLWILVHVHAVEWLNYVKTEN